MFRKDRIAELVQVARQREELERGGNVYDDVPEDFWNQRKKEE